MRATVASISALLLSVAILLMGSGLQSTLLPVRASLENFRTTEIGLMGSSYYVGFALGCFYGGRAVQRVGHIRTYTALTAIAAAVVLIHALAIDPLAWAVLRALTGVCFAGLFLVIESWLNDRAGNDNRGLVMGIYTMVYLTVIVAGQMMLTLADPSQFALFAFASILVSIAAVPVALTRSPEPKPVAEVRLRLGKLYRGSPSGMVGVLMGGMATGAFWSLGPSYAIGVGADANEVAIFMSIAVLGGALVQWPIGRLSDRLDRRAVLVAACGVGALAAGCFVLFDVGKGYAGASLTAVFGAATMPIYAIAAAHAFDLVERSDYVETSSGLLLANSIGAVVGPLAASIVMRWVGPNGMFLATGAAHLALGAFVVWRMKRSAPVPPEQRTKFDLAGTAPTMVPSQSEDEHASRAPL